MPRRKNTLPPDVLRIYDKLSEFYNQRDSSGRKWCNARYGIYCFYDYDGEPIYVGQTKERLRTRINRHLTNQRTDAVAMNVLDPLEVAEIEVWPFWDLVEEPKNATHVLNAAEYTVYSIVKSNSSVGAVLNEKVPPMVEPIELPPSFRQTIIPADIDERLSHKDTRIAQRANTIARLSNVMTQRDVSLGLRHTLIVQARRLLRLAEDRYIEVRGETSAEDVVAETIGSETDAEEDS